MFEKQLEAFEKFRQLKIGALFMQMGTGKTRIAIELVNYNNPDLLIYITPFATKNNIQTEFDKWQVHCQYLIVGYETIQSSDREFMSLLNLMQNKKCFIIADESIFIKNERTKRFQRLLYLRKFAEYALILNGTPITKNEWDIYNQMEFLSSLIMNMCRIEFLNTFFKKITFKKKGVKEKTFYKFSEVNAELLQKLIAPYIFNADFDFELEVAKNYNYVDYIGNEYYIRKEEKLKEIINFSDRATIISMLTLLNVIASNCKEKLDKVIEYSKNKQCIIYCNFLNEANYLHNNCDSFLITGKIKDRHLIIEEFKNSNKPLIMTFGTGSYSLNLQFCNEIVYSSLNFDYGLIEQSKYRIKRIGQNRNIKYTYFLTDLGINKMILENLEKKRTLKSLLEEKIINNEVKEWLKSM